MFKEIVSNLTQKTLNISKTVGHSFTDSLVSQVKDRSPVLGNLAGKYVKNKRTATQLNKDQIHASRIYAAENVDKDFGQEVKKENGDLNPQDLAKKMEEILSNLQKTAKKSPDKLEEDPLYKKYGKFFEENKEQFKKAQEEKKKETATTGGATDAAGPAVDSDGIITKLDSIEANTAETVKKISELSNTEEKKDEKSEDSSVTELKKISKFLEAQALDDKLDEAQVLEDKNEGVTVNKDPSVLDKITDDLNKKHDGPEIVEKKSLLAKAKDLILNRTTATPNKPGSITDGIKNTAKNNVKIPSGPSKLIGAVKSVGSLGMRALGGLASAAASPLALGAAGVAAAGVAGYAAGNWLNENTDIQANIASGVDKAKGWFGNSDEDKKKEVDKKSAQNLYEKRVSEGKLTSKSAAFFEQQGIKVDKSKIVDMPTAVKSDITQAVATTVATQESLANKPPASTQPIILNNNNTSTSSGSSGMQMLTGVNIRNSDTTFERVQMQDFWPRTE